MNNEQIFRLSLGIASLSQFNSLESVPYLTDYEKNIVNKLYDYLKNKQLEVSS